MLKTIPIIKDYKDVSDYGIDDTSGDIVLNYNNGDVYTGNYDRLNDNYDYFIKSRDGTYVSYNNDGNITEISGSVFIEDMIIGIGNVNFYDDSIGNDLNTTYKGQIEQNQYNGRGEYKDIKNGITLKGTFKDNYFTHGFIVSNDNMYGNYEKTVLFTQPNSFLDLNDNTKVSIVYKSNGIRIITYEGNVKQITPFNFVPDKWGTRILYNKEGTKISKQYDGYFNKGFYDYIGKIIFYSDTSMNKMYVGQFSNGKIFVDGLVGDFYILDNDKRIYQLYRGAWLNKKRHSSVSFYKGLTDKFYNGSWVNDEKMMGVQLYNEIDKKYMYIGTFKNNKKGGDGLLILKRPNRDTREPNLKKYILQVGYFENGELKDGKEFIPNLREYEYKTNIDVNDNYTYSNRMIEGNKFIVENRGTGRVDDPTYIYYSNEKSMNIDQMFYMLDRLQEQHNMFMIQRPTVESYDSVIDFFKRSLKSYSDINTFISDVSLPINYYQHSLTGDVEIDMDGGRNRRKRTYKKNIRKVRNTKVKRRKYNKNRKNNLV
jgi:hypothetical protein